MPRHGNGWAEEKKMNNQNEVDFGNEKVMVVNITKSYNNYCKRGLSEYDATRGFWFIPQEDLEKMNSAKYVVAFADGLIKAVFNPIEWHPATEDRTGLEETFKKFDMPFKLFGRWAFTGNPTKPEWVGKECSIQFELGRPIKYINC